MTEHRITIRDAEPVLRRAMRTYLWRRHLRRARMLLGWVLLLAGTIVVVATDGTGFLAGAAMASIALMGLVSVLAWRARCAATISRWRKIGTSGAELVFDDASFSISSSAGSVSIPWSEFVEVWFQPECWLLFTANDQFQIVPIAGVPSDALAFLRGRLAAAMPRQPARSGDGDPDT